MERGSRQPGHPGHVEPALWRMRMAIIIYTLYIYITSIFVAFQGMPMALLFTVHCILTESWAGSYRATN